MFQELERYRERKRAVSKKSVDDWNDWNWDDRWMMFWVFNFHIIREGNSFVPIKVVSFVATFFCFYNLVYFNSTTNTFFRQFCRIELKWNSTKIYFFRCRQTFINFFLWIFMPCDDLKITVRRLCLCVSHRKTRKNYSRRICSAN